MHAARADTAVPPLYLVIVPRARAWATLVDALVLVDTGKVA